MSGRTLAVAVLVGAVVLAGCSGTPLAPTESPTPTSSPSPTPTAEPPTATPAVSAAVEGTLEVHVINVGQAASTLVVSPAGETMLIDSGRYDDHGAYVLQYLQRLGIDRIDHLVTTHADGDHVGGHAAVVDYYETEADGVGTVYEPGIPADTPAYEAYRDAVETHGVPTRVTREGDAIQFAGVDVRVLGPPEPYIQNRSRNENSIVLELGFGATSFLFTGDAEYYQEQYLVAEYGRTLDATVLEAGHHGSVSSTTEGLLDAASPRAVAVSSAYDSRLGHPSTAVLDRLSDRSIPAFWTATHGNIVFESDGSRVVARTQRAASTDPDRLRAGEPIAPGTTGPVHLQAVVRGGGGSTATVTPVRTDGGSTGAGTGAT